MALQLILKVIAALSLYLCAASAPLKGEDVALNAIRHASHSSISATGSSDLDMLSRDYELPSFQELDEGDFITTDIQGGNKHLNAVHQLRGASGAAAAASQIAAMQARLQQHLAALQQQAAAAARNNALANRARQRTRQIPF